jgi:hypothetical protein
MSELVVVAGIGIVVAAGARCARVLIERRISAVRRSRVFDESGLLSRSSLPTRLHVELLRASRNGGSVDTLVYGFEDARRANHVAVELAAQLKFPAAGFRIDDVRIAVIRYRGGEATPPASMPRIIEGEQPILSIPSAGRATDELLAEIGSQLQRAGLAA